MDLHYNAFISYRHHPQDIKVAETIHRSLERFRVPKALKKQGKTIDRLFRDKEELPITSSLTDTITMALRNSDYQIVICSTHLKDSYWVQREIETFLQTHTKDKVLTVLVDGDNPYDVIPEILTYNEVTDPDTGEIRREPIEPLSCDWRLPHRKAMKEELPRLAAVLLGCSYDDLRQRQKQYRMRRLITGLSIGVAASLALAGYFLHTGIQIQENLNRSLRNQSQYLASASQDVLSSGDRLTAIALALEALPGTDNERPYVAIAEQALTDALMLYEQNTEVTSVASFGADALVDDFVVTDDAETLYIIDDRSIVTVWDTTTFRKLSAFSIGTCNSALLTDNDGNLLVIGGENQATLLCYNRSGDLLWQLENCSDIAFCQGKNTLLALRTENVQSLEHIGLQNFLLLQIDPNSGQYLAEPFLLFSSETAYGPALASDTYYEGRPIPISTYSTEADSCIYLADPTTGTCAAALHYSNLMETLSVSEDGHMFALVSDGSGMMNGRYQSYYTYSPAGAVLHCIDMTKNKTLWTRQLTSCTYSASNTVAVIPDSDRIFCQYGSTYFQLDGSTGKILAECNGPDYPLDLIISADSVWLLLANGTAGTYDFADNTVSVIQYMDSGLLMGHANHGIYILPELSTDVILYRTVADDSYVTFSGEYETYISDARICGDYLATISYKYMQVFNMSTRELLWKTEINYSHDLIDFSPDGSTLYVLDDRGPMLEYDTLSGTVTRWELPTADMPQLYISKDTMYLSDGSLYYIVTNYTDNLPYLVSCSLDTHEGILYPILSEDAAASWDPWTNRLRIEHVGAQYILLWSGGDLYRFDRTTGQVQLLLTDIAEHPNFLYDTEKDSLTLAVDQEIWVIDVKSSEISRTISLPNYTALSFCYRDGDLLALCDDGQVHRFDSKGNELSVICLSLYSTFYSGVKYLYTEEIGITWQFTGDGALVLRALDMGNIINTEQSTYTCDVPYLITYHAGTDSFICKSGSTFTAYSRCSLEDLMLKAEDALGEFELTADQRAYYGLNETT